MKTLTEKQGSVLLRIARAAIAKRLGLEWELPQTNEAVFTEASGTFVTLKLNDKLRGCIGNIEPVRSLLDGILGNAVNAAFQDYRFSPLSLEEFEEVIVSVSVLGPACKLTYADADDLLAKLRPGVDGVILRHGVRSATFLPQVWEQLTDAEQFLSHLCLKAGLTKEFWRSGEAEISVYQVQSFTEDQR
jgi:AmmeMemoRadiSam system protein A